MNEKEIKQYIQQALTTTFNKVKNTLLVYNIDPAIFIDLEEAMNIDMSEEEYLEYLCRVNGGYVIERLGLDEEKYNKFCR